MRQFISAFILCVTSNIALAGATEDANKKMVKEFYEQVFVQHQAKGAAEKYLAASYIQHNPHVATGRQPFIDFFVPFYEKNPNARAEIKRIVAEGDLVVLHVLSKMRPGDIGNAVVDIFRVENGKIAEHWDVMQKIPENSANQNSMF